MEKSNFTDEQIDNYIMGLLDNKDKSLFEEALGRDEALQLRLTERKELVFGIQEYHAQEFKNKLKKIHSKAFDTAPVQEAKRRSLVPWLAAAATIALLIVALMWLNDTPTSEELFASNFKTFELSLAQRDQADAELLNLEQLYNEGKYQEALPLFETMLKESGNANMQLQLGAGVAKLGLNQPKEALTHFETILNSGDLFFKDHALWYSALAHLKMDDQAKAKTLLQQLVDAEDADHHKEAVKLLGKLK